MTVRATSTSVVAQPVVTSFCPSIAPFTVPLGIIVQASGLTNVLVTAISLQFTDTAGVRMPQVTLAAPLPTVQFGTALIAARSAQTFPIALGIGCRTGRSGVVVVTVDASDQQGRRDSGQVVVSVR